MTDIALILCMTLGGLSMSLLHRADALTLALLSGITLVVMLFYTLILKKQSPFKKKFSVLKYPLAVCSVIAAAVSAANATALVTRTTVLDKSFVPLAMTLTLAFALVISLSKQYALPRTALVTVSVSAVVLVILIFLCVTETELSAIELGRLKTNFLLPLVAFSVCDTVFVLPLMTRTPKFRLLLGSAVALTYFLLTTLIALSALSNGLFFEFEMPIMKLWQSAYIPSFLSRFETVAVCVFFILSAFKSGLLLNYAISAFGKSCFYMIALLFAALSVAIFVWPILVYFAAILTVLCAFAAPFMPLDKNY